MVDLGNPLVVAADWTVAAILVLSGAVAWRWSRPTAVLLGVAGVLWVLGGLLSPALFWHRGVMVQTILAYPGWRPTSRTATVVIAATYVAAVAAPVSLLTEPVTIGLAVAAASAAAWNVRGATGLARHHRTVALAASFAFALAVVVGALLRLLMSVDVSAISLLLYEAGVVVAAVTLLAGLRPPAATLVTDLVVDLGGTRSTSLRDEMARTLRDPDLRLGFWDDEAGGHLDEFGRLLDGLHREGRAKVPIDRDGEPVALILLDETLARDPRVVAAVRTATRIAAVNAQRQQEVLTQLQQLRASRQRLVTAADDERQRLERQLRERVLRPLSALTQQLRDLDVEPSSHHPQRALHHLERTVEDLEAAAAGLRPRDLDQGLARALADLADRAPVSVSLEGAASCADGLRHEVELTVWYLCTEALSNTAKHAPGARLSIVLCHLDGLLRVRLADDGPGGASPHPRGGLSGLRDRVEALGGRFELHSGPSGTALVADLPLDRPSATGRSSGVGQT